MARYDSTSMTATKCECTLAGHCNRHNVSKTKHLVKLCQERPEFWHAWENGRGPGQLWSQSDKDARSNVDATRAMIKTELAEAGRKCWDALFSGVFTEADLVAWEPTIPKWGCDCESFYNAWKASNPTDFYKNGCIEFESKYRLKKAVNEKLGHASVSIEEAARERMTPERVSAYWHSIGMLPPLKSYLDAVGWHQQYFAPTKPRCVLVLAPDDWTKQQLEITRPAFQAYAERCEADYIELTTDAYPAWPMANKLIQIPWVTSHYSRTFYFDADIVVKPKMPNLFHELPIGHYMAQDELPTIGQNGYCDWYFRNVDKLRELGFPYLKPTRVPNGGVLGLPRHAAAYTPPNVSLVEDWCIDQFVLGSQAPERETVWLDDRYNWGWIRKDWQEGLDDAYAIHLNGCHDREMRLRLLSELTAKYC